MTGVQVYTWDPKSLRAVWIYMFTWTVFAVTPWRSGSHLCTCHVSVKSTYWQSIVPWHFKTTWIMSSLLVSDLLYNIYPFCKSENKIHTELAKVYGSMALTNIEVEAYYFRLFQNLKRVKKINTSELKIRNLHQVFPFTLDMIFGNLIRGIFRWASHDFV